MSLRPTLLAVVGVLAAVALTGCTLPAPEPTPSSSSARPSGSATATQEPSSSATPSATPTSGPTAAPAALIVSTAGLGPLKVGRPMPAGTSLVSWKPGVCGSGWGLWAPKENAGFSINTKGGAERAPINGLQVSDPKFRTPSGLHVGSTKAEVAAALPTAKYHVADIYGKGDVAWYSVVAGGNRITFSITSQDGKVVTDSTKVQFIFVFPSTNDDTHYIATDGVGSCA